jgi:WD repeat-containing protein 35
MPAPPPPALPQVSADAYKPAATATTQDPITAVAAREGVLMVGRATGVVHRLSLPHLTPEGQYLLRCKPAALALNCNCSRMSVIDGNGVLSFADLTAKPATGHTLGEHLAFERKVLCCVVSQALSILRGRGAAYGNVSAVAQPCDL